MSVSLQDLANSFPTDDSRYTAPHSMSEFYDIPFSDSTSSAASGQISLNDFRNKTIQLYTPNPNPVSTTNITSTINPSPKTYNLDNYTYELNIAGPYGPQDPATTAKADVRGVDVHPNDNVKMRVYDSRFTGYSQLRFWGNGEGVFRNSINRSENNTFNNRFGPISNYTIITAINRFNAVDVVSCIIPIPGTVTKIEFIWTKTQAWAGFSITI